MKIIVLRSVDVDSEYPDLNPEYVQKLNTRYAGKVIGNLINDPSFCSACGPDCSFCRKRKAPSRGADIAAVFDFSAVLPYLIETPADYVPADVPVHDVLLAINIHEQILLEVLKVCNRWGTKGVVVPIEAPDCVSGASRAQAEEICSANGIELAFPKPFCAFDPPAESVLGRFRKHFRIGMPDVALEVKDGRIDKACVNVSAACGATYYIARWLEGKGVDDDLEFEVVSKRLHSYPCTASMEWDDELNETCLHVAGETHKRMLAPIKEIIDEGSGMMMSPVGVMVQKPVPVRENIENIEKAKADILRCLAEEGSLTLAQARQLGGKTPAAISSALLILKQDGRISVQNGVIRESG